MSDIPLREHLEARINANKDYFEERLRSMNLAVEKANDGMNHRLAGMNEWRASLNDMTNRMATKEDAARIEERLKTLEITGATGHGRATVMSVMWAIASSIIVGVILKVWKF